MKSLKRGTVLALCVFATAALLPMAAAADTAGTDSTVKFKDRDPGNAFEIIEPGTYETQITPAEGSNGTQGELQINWVPTIKFGEVEISTLSKAYSAKMATFTNDQTGIQQNIPQFVQVADTRTSGNFVLNVAMTTKFTAGSHVLAHSRIQLMGEGTMTNNLLDKTAENSNASAILAGVAAGTPSLSAARNEIPDGSTSINVLSSKGGYQTGSISSLVFAEGYTTGDNYATADENAGIKLYVPSGDNPQKGMDYTAELTWNLVNGL